MNVWKQDTKPSEQDMQKALSSFSQNGHHITLEEWRTQTPLYRSYTWKYAQIKLYKILVIFLGAATRDILTAIACNNQGLILSNAIENEMVPRTQARMTKRAELNEMKIEMKKDEVP